MNVIVTKNYYSLRAVFTAIEWLEITSHYANPAVKIKFDFEPGDGITLLVEMTRPGYNGTGYHMGTETCIFAILNARDCSQFGLLPGFFSIFVKLIVCRIIHPIFCRDTIQIGGHAFLFIIVDKSYYTPA